MGKSLFPLRERNEIVFLNGISWRNHCNEHRTKARSPLCIYNDCKLLFIVCQEITLTLNRKMIAYLYLDFDDANELWDALLFLYKIHISYRRSILGRYQSLCSDRINYRIKLKKNI